MIISPNSEVRLLAVPLNKDNKNQIDFISASEQWQYFVSLTGNAFTADDFSYIRQDNKLRIPLHVDQLLGRCNYVMYQNLHYGEKWFYAYVTKIEYVNDEMSFVYIKTDVFQTWMFDITLMPSFVLREHVADDSIGANLIPENLDTGEYVVEAAEYSNCLGSDIIIVGTTVVLDSPELGSSSVSGDLYSNVFSGVIYYRFHTDTTSINRLKTYLQTICDNGQADSIVCMFMFKNGFFDPNVWTDEVPNSQQMDKYITTTARISDLDGYVPKNNKLLSYPYRFLSVSNQHGGNAVYRYEYCTQQSGLYAFRVATNIAPNAVVYLIPTYYKGMAENRDEALVLAGFPQCSWNIDAYKNWLAQNSISIALSVAGSAAAVAGGIVTANPLAIAAGGIGIASELGQIQQHSIQPPQAKGNVAGAGGAAYSLGMFDFLFQHMTIQYQFAERIDKFFEMYGYKVNILKTPELRTRTYWNYIQTAGINLYGSIPEDDKLELKALFDNGITIWHDTDNYGNYGLDNH